MYDIIVAFFLVLTLVFAVVLFLYLNASSATLFGKLQESSAGPREAAIVKDALLACHRLEYVDERLLSDPCPADTMLRGYRITQHELNGCEAKSWERGQHDTYDQVTPFIITVEQVSGQRCLARLEVFSGT
jgi:hypothetical protein